MKPEGRLSPPDNAGLVLLPLARAAIAREIGRALAASEAHAWLREPGACFITLTHETRLRGCIGTLNAHRALGEDVKANAVAAAFRDPRFKPLSAGEFDAIDVEISLLSPLEDLAFGDESDALRQLRPGVDGLVFQYGHHRSTFLPQVWREFAEPAEFIAHLKYKAGLPPDFWDPEVKLARYTVTKWCESELRALRS
ncbi:MAG TPA: AmmeMemoRadiSam system protein A [Burkholderiales bacterium]|jgi:AmmeMemoRadiSam system protein A|nr:AmmeMemoRadiSam system protein A [Burkholderiales bacterium]